MPTITLYAGKANQVPGLMGNARRSVREYRADLEALRTKVLSIDGSTCDVEEVARSIRASSQTQEAKEEALGRLEAEVEGFLADVVRIDGEVADVINQGKEDFYEEHPYLKPDCEKNGWERFKDGCKKFGQWCREHWKEILAVVVIVTGVILCFVPGLNWLGSGILMGALKGALSGGLIGGLSSWASGGSFWEGFKDGAVTGAIFGGAFGGLGAAGRFLGNAKAMGLLANGQWLEKSCKFARTVGTISKVSGTITFALGSFDTLALGSKILFGDNWLSNFNAALHKSTVYNAAQTVIAGVAVFSGGMNKGFHDATNRAGVRPSCFVAGTMVLTAMGLVAIENVKAGDRVTSTDPETMKAGEKAVLETYVREVDRLVRLTVSGEEIVTTLDHPFYVRGRGFVSAGGLWVGARLLDAGGNVLFVERMEVELLDGPVKVYNFQVEGFHTYHVSGLGVLVHNADKGYKVPKSGTGKEKATNIPSRFKGERPFVNESGKDFAKRLCDAAYGAGNYDTGPRSDYNMLKKYGDRAFSNPKK